MFRTGSPYSSFFMSGLMSDTNSVDFRRRGSLPTDTSAPTSNYNGRNVDQERSFLSLDLAESQSLHSEKRRQMVSKGSFEKLKVPHSAPLRMRSSRDTLRNVPSPKPAPLSTLPQLPRKYKTVNLKSPRLTPITNNSSRPDLDLVSPLSITPASSVLPLTPSVTINTAVAPPLRSNSIASSSTVSTHYRRTKRSDALARLEGRSPRIVTSPLRSAGSNRNFMSMSDDEGSEDEDEDEEGDVESEAGGDDSDETDSFVDLAIDFGSSPVSPTRRKYENAFGFEDDEDVIIPRSPVRYSRSLRKHAYSHSLASFSTSMSPYRARSSAKSLSARSLHRSHSQSHSQMYSLVHSAPPSSITSSPPRRRRSRTLTMFPLTSFIDFKGDASGKDELKSSRDGVRHSLQSRKSEDSWRWRSWIEIAGVS